MASPHDNEQRTGGGTNYVCLPSGNVTYAKTNTRSTTSSKTSYIDGVKYGSRDLFKTTDPLFLYGRAVCTACQHFGKTITLMIPGIGSCPKNGKGQKWTTEYSGYLMADSRRKTDFICVDRNAESDGKSLRETRTIGRLNFVTAKWPDCFANKCGVYNNTESALRCVVCSM